MAIDPRSFLVKNCAIDTNAHIKRTSERKTFFDGIGKIGDVEVFNKFGLGKVSEGLRTISKASDSIRAGRNVSVVPGVDNNVSDDQGANAIVSQTGINPRAAQQNKSFNPGVVNRGFSAAKQVWQKAKQGNFTLSDIPEFVSDISNLGIFIDKIFTPSKGAIPREVSKCYARPYAMDLIKRAPKYKFLFVVQFTFNTGYLELDKVEDFNNFAFVVKQSDRPTIQFEYEDINMYNFKTKVIRKSTYNPIGMRFYDDDTNNIMHFYNTYLRAMSPVSNMKKEQTHSYENAGLAFNVKDGLGLNQSAAQSAVKTHRYSASIGPLLENNKTIIKEITLYHVFRYGELMNVYHFFDPKLLEMQLDELAMADSGEGNEMSLQFAYDGLYVEPDTAVSSGKLEALTSKGNQYPLRYNGDLTTAAEGMNDDIASVFNDPAQELINRAESLETEVKKYNSTLPDSIKKDFIKRAQELRLKVGI